LGKNYKVKKSKFEMEEVKKHNCNGSEEGILVRDHAFF
jgi:hypothetical protein